MLSAQLEAQNTRLKSMLIHEIQWGTPLIGFATFWLVPVSALANHPARDGLRRHEDTDFYAFSSPEAAKAAIRTVLELPQ
jgi:hypothetical protein